MISLLLAVVKSLVEEYVRGTTIAVASGLLQSDPLAPGVVELVPPLIRPQHARNVMARFDCIPAVLDNAVKHVLDGSLIGLEVHARDATTSRCQQVPWPLCQEVRLTPSWTYIVCFTWILSESFL